MDNDAAEAILEQPTSFGGLRVWHIIFIGFGIVLGVIMMLCCCFRFRIPRTKQDIESDYHRKKLTRKFREKLDCMNNTDIDDMDLMKALEKIREDFLTEMEKVRGKDSEYTKKFDMNNPEGNEENIKTIYNGV